MQKEVSDIMVMEPLFWDKCFSPPLSPKNMSVRTISPELSSKLNKIWHSRLPKIQPSNIYRNRNYICFAAYYMGVYIACGIWSSPVNQSYCVDTTLELRRMAISEFCPKNTATWFLSKMIYKIKKELPLISKLISYQDTEVHNGTIYKAGNWFIDGETKYRDWTKTRKRSKPQTTADKIRWAYIIPKPKNHTI